MQLTAAVAFAAIALTLIAIPGPDWAFVLAAGARDHVVVPAITGLMAGYALITVVVVVGVGTLLAASPAALTVLTLAGAGYVTYLGVRTLRSSARVPDDDRPPLAGTPAGYVARGAGVSALNPKGLLLFVAILPQFAHPAEPWPMPLQLAGLGVLYIAIAAAFYLGLGFAADRVLGARPSVAVVTSKIAGVAMVVVGVALVAERLAGAA